MIIDDSERLSYSVMTPADAELMYQLDQDVEVMHFINGGTLTSRQDIEKVYMPRMQSYTNRDEGWGIWKVMLKHENTFVGWILVRPMDFFGEHPENDNLELGWRFSRDSWGKGYATEAALCIKNALVKLGNIKKLSAIAIEENTASTNIMTKLGMRFIKKDIHKDPLGDDFVVFYEVDV